MDNGIADDAILIMRQGVAINEFRGSAKVFSSSKNGMQGKDHVFSSYRSLAESLSSRTSPRSPP